MFGFFGRILEIDAGSGASAYRDLPADAARKCLGGVGLGTWLLHEYAPLHVDPLSPANPLIFATAPLVGTAMTTSAKFAVVAKSPLTGFVTDSLASGRFALALKGLGIDALVVIGRAPALACVFLDGDRIEMRDVSRFAGRSAADTELLVRAVFDCPSASVAAIGAAGERGVRFATISSEGRHAGRGGLGCVMGAKNLKAIAIRGRRQAPVACPEQVQRLAEVLRRRSAGPVMDTHRQVGTVGNMSVLNRLGALPTRNFQQPTFEAARALSGETLHQTSFNRRHGCAACAIRCERRFRSPQTSEQRLEYETLFALGPLCGIGESDCVIDAAALCDRYGLDAVSTGVTLAWAMESADRGILPEAGVLGLRFGRGDALLSQIHAIAAREGLGDLLAEGCRRAAEAIGQGSDRWAMHVKGLELPGYEPRSLKATALGLAVNPRGACHNRSGAHDVDFSGDVNRFHGDSTLGPMVAAAEDRAAVLDSLIVCRFLRRCFVDFYAENAQMLSAVTGWDYCAREVEGAGERIHTLKKLFNIREGWTPSDDWLPERLLTEPLATGPCTGTGLSPDELCGMIRSYYSARGWNGQGFVPARKLEELGIAPTPSARHSRTSAAHSRVDAPVTCTINAPRAREKRTFTASAAGPASSNFPVPRSRQP